MCENCGFLWVLNDIQHFDRRRQTEKLYKLNNIDMIFCKQGYGINWRVCICAKEEGKGETFFKAQSQCLFLNKTGKFPLIKDYRRGTEQLLGITACNVEKEVTYYKLLWTNLHILLLKLREILIDQHFLCKLWYVLSRNPH